MQYLTNLIVERPAQFGLFVAALIVVLGLLVYGFHDLLKFTFKRVWAISGVVFRESIRRKILWLTPLAMLGIVVLTGLQQPDDEQDAVRQTIKFCLFASGLLVVISGIMLSCTNLPRDIESKVIFTIVTKPTTRLEIILGKIIGFARVTGAILLLMGVFTWSYMHVRAWQLDREIAQKLAVPLDNEFERGRLEHHRREGLLDTRTLRQASNMLTVAREPKAGDETLWISTQQNFVIPFQTQPKDLVPRGFDESNGTIPPGAAGLRLHLTLTAEQVGRVERAQPTVRAPFLPDPTASTNPFGEPSVTVSIVNLDAEGTEVIPSQVIHGNSPITLPADKLGQVLVIGIDDKSAPALANVRHWAVQIASSNENYLIGAKPGSVKIIVPGNGPTNEQTINPYAGPSGTSPTLIARGNAGRAGRLLEGPSETSHAVTICRFDGAEPRPASDGTVAIEMLAGIERLDDDSNADATQVGVQVVNHTSGEVSEVRYVTPENSKTIYADLPGNFFKGGKFDVRLQTMTRGHAIALGQNGVAVVQSKHSFGLNLAKSLLSQWMLSVLVVTIGTFCSTFVSWPIAIVLSVVMLMGHWAVEQVRDSLQPGIGATVATDIGAGDATRARVISATVDSLARMLNFVAQFLPNIDLFSTGELLERNLNVPLAALGSGGMVLLVFGLPLLTLSYIVLRNKEVAP